MAEVQGGGPYYGSRDGTASDITACVADGQKNHDSAIEWHFEQAIMAQSSCFQLNDGLHYFFFG
eukprot:scaffold167459_cov70-Attheya_sp.AAC.4